MFNNTCKLLLFLFVTDFILNTVFLQKIYARKEPRSMKEHVSFKEIDSIAMSNYILKHYGPMSHLKLQKLLFYCDAYHLAYFDKQLISDKFEAWVHGPVSRKVYRNLSDKSILYADLSFSPIEGINEDECFNELASIQQEFISSVLEDLHTWTGLQLEIATHREEPWIAARKGYGEADKCCVEIDKEITRIYYKKDICA